MHTITKNTASCDGWFVLSTFPAYSVVYNKQSKWNNWKQNFYIIKTDNKEVVAQFNQFNPAPLWSGRDPKLVRPPIDPRLEYQLEYFKVKRIALGTQGETTVVPCHWVPDAVWLSNSLFMSFAGIVPNFTKGITGLVS